jgi:Flp pilus assembly protein TadB
MHDPGTNEPEAGRRRPARRWLLPPLIAVVGVVLVLATSGTWEIVGAGVIGVAAVVAVSLAFLEVGYSEDRARARGE